jgi:GT2 family glycosyltransferase
VKISIIIPLKQDGNYIRETLAAIKRLAHGDHEIIVLPDEPYSWGDGVRVIPTGAAGPAAKRDLALKYAQGDLLAYLDDDTFPDQQWLTNAENYFDDTRVAAIGGPAVTPPEDSFWQQASGYVYTSWLGGGHYNYRYLRRAAREVDDYPTCNLIVRRSVMQALGGFDTAFWPGEDTKLCLDIIHRGWRILYVPDVLVYHHRRPLFGGHLAQVRNYARHRGYFVRRFPETSFRASYFLPTLLVAGLCAGAMFSFLIPNFWMLYLAGVLGYGIAAVLSAAMASRDVLLTPVVTLGIIATHLVYGIWFVFGLLAPKLSEE